MHFYTYLRFTVDVTEQKEIGDPKRKINFVVYRITSDVLYLFYLQNANKLKSAQHSLTRSKRRVHKVLAMVCVFAIPVLTHITLKISVAFTTPKQHIACRL